MKAEKYQIEETAKEIASLIESGIKQITLNEYKLKLKEFNLKLDLNPKGYLLKYYNTSNPQHYLCATTMAIDETGYSYANIYGKFYQDHLKKNTPIGNKFRRFRNNYFCILKSGHILSI